LLVSAVVAASPPPRAPSFEDFAVRERPPATLAAPDLASHPQARRYRTMLRRAAKTGVTLAGHFTTLTLGCGSSCVFLAVIDRATGRVFFPDELGVLSTVDFDDDAGYRTRPDSRLVVACGDPKESDQSACRYYEWTGTSARLVATIPGGRAAGDR
jgi:hypothetical protein